MGFFIKLAVLFNTGSLSMFSASSREDDAVEVMDVDPQQDQIMFQDVSYFCSIPRDVFTLLKLNVLKNSMLPGQIKSVCNRRK